MFISEEEAHARLKSADNLIVRLRNSRPNPPVERTERKKEVDPDPSPTKAQPLDTPPTFASAEDPARLADLAERRATKPVTERGGKYEGQGPIPPIFRSLIGGAARLGTINHTAASFGVSTPTTLNYKHGRTSAKGEVDPDMLSSIERDTHAIRQQVLGVLAFTIAKITPESIENKEPKELSIIARNLSSVMAGTRPIEAPDNSRNAQVIVFSPEQQTKDDYGTVEIG